jgi:1-acyl-sn-glycerol-3-phosphate acyltransferase
MRRIIGWFIFKVVLGWKRIGDVPPPGENYLVVATPHTANKDWLVGLMGFWAHGTRIRILIKKESFEGIAGPILRALGGIPVDRKSGNTGLISQLKQLIERNKGKRKGIAICITPEGTRKFGKNWKTGFYHIAYGTGIPIWLGYLNYAKKEITWGLRFVPSGDEAADFAAIRKWYSDKPAIGKVPFDGHQEIWPKGEGLDAMQPEELAEWRRKHEARLTQLILAQKSR